MQNIQIENIFKRNFAKKPFQLEKITDAILRAMISVNKGDVKDAEDISMEVYNELLCRKKESPNYIPNVEEIQDLVEHKLMQSKFLDVAKAYTFYTEIRKRKTKSAICLKKVLL